MSNYNAFVPDYSLTGDILSFLTCNLQYRYQNRGTLPPSKPVQLWFGEFIHGVLEEAYRKYESGFKEFPWDWLEDIRPLEELIDERLQIRGLHPPEDYFYPFNKNENITPPKLLYSIRTESAINTIGPYLFPLVEDAEIHLANTRKFQDTGNNKVRGDYYSISGVIDVLASTNQDVLNELFNNVLSFLENPNTNPDTIDDFEVIVEYKGMKRPPLNSENWLRHNKQIQTYAYLRDTQENSKPVAFGIIFYLNELEPSEMDIKNINEDIINQTTDITGYSEDEMEIRKWEETGKFPELSRKFKLNRCIRIVEIDNKSIKNSLNEFEEVVSHIENSIVSEMECESIKDSWKSNGDERTCNGCDFKTFCTSSKNKDFQIP